MEVALLEIVNRSTVAESQIMSTFVNYKSISGKEEGQS